MIKLAIFGAILGLVASQMPQNFMMMQMMNNMYSASNSQGGNSQGSGSSQGGAAGNSQENYLNNALLCRNTRNLAFVPCANFPDVCNMISMRTYTMPNLLKCSALGTGCCLRDMATMFLAQNMGAS